jgi:hypothetical protein
MAIFLVAVAIIGILLGLRFKVLVLVPASVLAAVVIILILSESAHELSVIVLTLVGTLVALQMGYIAGGILRYLVRAYLPAWTRHRRPGRNAK